MHALQNMQCAVVRHLWQEACLSSRLVASSAFQNYLEKTIAPGLLESVTQTRNALRTGSPAKRGAPFGLSLLLVVSAFRVPAAQGCSAGSPARLLVTPRLYLRGTISGLQQHA